jgi:hypothetical protein
MNQALYQTVARATNRYLKGATSAWALAISPDSKTVAAGGTDTTVTGRDIATGEILQVLPEQEPLHGPHNPKRLSVT